MAKISSRDIRFANNEQVDKYYGLSLDKMNGSEKDTTCRSIVALIQSGRIYINQNAPLVPELIIQALELRNSVDYCILEYDKNNTKVRCIKDIC